MRYGKYLMTVLAFSIVACEIDDPGVDTNTPGPAALVRFINAVVDTGTVDLRFVDRVENLPTMQGVAFRAASGVFQRVEPGNRVARVFVNSTDPVVTQIRLVDTTLTLNVNERYTLVYAGRANNNQDRLAVVDEPETLPAPTGDNIAIKILHAATGTANVDVHIAPADTAGNNADPIANAVAVVRNVPFLSNSAYVTVPRRTGAGRYQFAVTAAGSTTVLFSGRPNLPGAAATVSTTGPSPGVTIAGSVLTAVVMPASVAGTRQSTSGTQTPTVMLLIDKPLNP
jgi:hypothetical protein